MAQAVALSHPHEGCAVLMVPDDSYHFGGGLRRTQVPQAEFDSGMVVEEIIHEPPGFLSGMLRNSQLRWPTEDREAFVIVSTFRSLEYLPWNAVNIFTDDRNLAYIFDPKACLSVVPKTVGQRLKSWKSSWDSSITLSCISLVNVTVGGICYLDDEDTVGGGEGRCGLCA